MECAEIILSSSICHDEGCRTRKAHFFLVLKVCCLTIVFQLHRARNVISWKILDLTIAMTYAMLSPFGKTKHSLAAAAAMLRGYCSICSLTDLERRHLRLLISCRLACSITWGAYSFKKNPDNKYILLHAKPALKALELIWGGGCDESSIEQLFNAASEGPNISPLSDDIIDCANIAIPDPSVVDVLQASRVSCNCAVNDGIR